MATTITKLADFIDRTNFEDIPERVIHETKRLLLDSIGCALAGVTADKGKWGVEYVRSLYGGAPQATILGLGEKTCAAGAAFAPHLGEGHPDAVSAAGLPNHPHLGVRIALKLVDGHNGGQTVYLCNILHVPEQVGQAACQGLKILFPQLGFGAATVVLEGADGGHNDHRVR